MYLFLSLAYMAVRQNPSESQYYGAAMISFDEGPSENVDTILEILDAHDLKAVFYLDPNKIADHAKAVQRIIEKAHSIGLSIVETFSDLNDEQIMEIILKNLNLFKESTKFNPRAVRLPRSGYKENAINIAEKMGLTVTEPTIDSEDIEIPHYIDYLIPAIESKDPNTSYISVVLRDFKKSSVANLEKIINALQSKEFVISDLSTYSGLDIEAVAMTKEDLEMLKKNVQMLNSDKLDLINKNNSNKIPGDLKTGKDVVRNGISIIQKDENDDSDSDEDSGDKNEEIEENEIKSGDKKNAQKRLTGNEIIRKNVTGKKDEIIRENTLEISGNKNISESLGKIVPIKEQLPNTDPVPNDPVPKNNPVVGNNQSISGNQNKIKNEESGKLEPETEKKTVFIAKLNDGDISRMRMMGLFSDKVFYD